MTFSSRSSSTTIMECDSNDGQNFKPFQDHEKFVARIRKTLYYGQMARTQRFSLPVAEAAVKLFSNRTGQCRRLDRLDVERASAVSREACISPCSLVLALLYIERLHSCNPQYLREIAPSELFVVSTMVASKYLHDDGEEDEVYNGEWAASSGIDTPDLNQLEIEFLQAMDWKVFVSDKSFWNTLHQIECHVAFLEGTRRGWYSYTDLGLLLNSKNEVAELAQLFIKVAFVCLASYAASVMTLISSAYVVSNLHPTNLGYSRPSFSSSSNVSGNQVLSIPALVENQNESNLTAFDVVLMEMTSLAEEKQMWWSTSGMLRGFTGKASDGGVSFPAVNFESLKVYPRWTDCESSSSLCSRSSELCFGRCDSAFDQVVTINTA